MIQGTTPTHTFTIPFDVSLIKELKVVYAQQGEIVLEKNKEGATLEGNAITVKLTQEETFAFNADTSVNIQLRILTEGGEALASVPQKVSVAECLDKEVLA